MGSGVCALTSGSVPANRAFRSAGGPATARPARARGASPGASIRRGYGPGARRETGISLGGQQALEEPAVALERNAQVLGRDVLAAAPLLLEPLALGREAVGQLAHHLGDQL